MTSDQETQPHLPGHRAATLTRWTTKKRVQLRRRKLPTVRLGNGRPRRGALVLRSLWRRMRLKWLKIQYRCILKKLKIYYRKMIKEIIEAGAAMDTFQQHMLLEVGSAVPVMGVNFANTFSAGDRSRAMIF